MYREAYNRSLDASYRSSEFKIYADQSSDYAKSHYPLLSGGLTLGYSAYVKQQVQLNTNKYSVLGSTRVGLTATNKQAYTSISWSF